MISETRQIVFSNDELIRAIKDFDRNHKNALPPGKIVECTLKDAPLSARLLIDTVWLDKGKSAILNESSLAAVLIYACAVRRIPLPRRAKKSLRAIGNDLALDLTLEALDEDYYVEVDEPISDVCAAV
ncbi:MAG: hypothetical protein QNJ67_20040 [Kiloniellales bacterium]|nr:hypothetical protein [Kiloniellales bacterium]